MVYNLVTSVSKKQQTQAMTFLTVLVPAAPGYNHKSPGGTACWPPQCRSIRCFLSHYVHQNQTHTILHPTRHTHTHTYTTLNYHYQSKIMENINKSLIFKLQLTALFVRDNDMETGVTFSQLSQLCSKLTDVTPPHQLL